MQRRLVFIFFGALSIASAASFMVYRLTTPNGSPAAATARVVVADRDLEAGALIHESDLRVVDWAGPVPAGSASNPAAALNRGVVSTIYKGEPVTDNRLAAAGSGGGLAAMIPAGMRACAVRVNEVVGVAGFVIPGMRVDVLITGAAPSNTGASVPSVRTLLQNIKVLSAGDKIDKDNDGKPLQAQVVNLLVDPHQAEILSLAGNETRIQLVLRNPSDTATTVPQGISMSELFQAPAERSVRVTPAPVAVIAPAAPPAVPATVEVLNGATHTLVRFPATEAPK